jgi:CRISPR-associated protein Csx3
MSSYKISAEKTPAGVLLRVAFGDAAQNDRIVVDAVAALDECKLTGGETVLINGPASLPVAMALSHGVTHLFKEVACFDPKINAYVVAVSHGGRRIGDLIKV